VLAIRSPVLGRVGASKIVRLRYRAAEVRCDECCAAGRRQTFRSAISLGRATAASRLADEIADQADPDGEAATSQNVLSGEHGGDGGDPGADRCRRGTG
jgi:hypothetical protein